MEAHGQRLGGVPPQRKNRRLNGENLGTQSGRGGDSEEFASWLVK